MPIHGKAEKLDLLSAALPSGRDITKIIYKPVSKHFGALSVVPIITLNNASHQYGL